MLASPKATAQQSVENSAGRAGDTEMRDYERQMSQIKKNLAIFNIEVENLSTAGSGKVNELEASRLLSESKISKRGG